MFGSIVEFFQSAGLAPLGACLGWRPDLMAARAAAEAVSAAAALAVAAAIWQVARARGGFGRRPAVLALVLFLAALAAARLAALATLWFPLHGVEAALMLAAAGLALAAAAGAWRLRPVALALRGPGAWLAQGSALRAEAGRRRAAELELHRTHAALEQANRELEERVARRTRDLTAANEELQRFAYIASHDLRAPLRALMTVPEWLRDTLVREYGAVHDDLEADLGEMERQSGRLDRLLQDLLSYARLGQSDAEHETLSPEPLIAESVGLAGVPEDFSVEIAGPFPPVRGIAEEFRLVIRNLITNAVKHHDRGAGRIAVSARPAGEMVVIEVRDDGPGIDRRFAQKIFEMFSTLRPRDEVEGSGMGLAMVRKSMERVGGHVRLGEGDGRGAVFELYFPAPAPEVCNEGDSRCSRSSSQRTASSRSATSRASLPSGTSPTN